MRQLKEFLRWLRDSLPVIEGGQVHFTKDALILLLVVVSALLTGLYVLGILVGGSF